MADKKHVIYVFGEFRLDRSERTFTAKGELIHLPAKEFDTLLYFVENAQRILPKDEMMSAIWDDTFVEEGNLAQYVSRLRKILNTNGHNYIQTLPKKGYRFDADVKTIEPSADMPPRRFVWLGVPAAVIVLLVILFVVFRNRSVLPAAKTNGPVLVALTDGKQDDGAVEWTNDNHIRFLRRVSPKRFESWIMNIDGSDQHREVSPIKDLQTGFWSPDGKKVFFMKEGDGKTTYLANADGSYETSLPLLVGNSDWAPDSSRFVYETRYEDHAEIFLYSVATKQNVDLTHNKNFNADPSFSPDGNQIAFLSGIDGNPEIYTMDLNGEHWRRLTNHPAFDNFPTISPDGTQLLFTSNRDGEEAHLYIRNLNDESPPTRLTDWSGVEGAHAKCWSPDGTQIAVSSDINGKDQIFLLNVEPYKPEEMLSDSSADLEGPRLSRDGKKLVYQARLVDQSIELRLTNIEDQSTRAIYKTEPGMSTGFFSGPNWSPDGSQIVFASKASGNADIYVINSDGSALKKLTDDPLPDLSPVFSADGKEIFFVRDIYGKAKLFRMNADGSDARPLTGKEGYEMSPGISPDGRTLLFSGDRVDGKSKALDIFSVQLGDLSSEKILASRPSHDGMAVFSPDGRKVAFTSLGDGNREIYVMNADGSGLFRLTRNKAEDTYPAFSADGRGVIFSSNREGKFQIYQVALPN